MPYSIDWYIENEIIYMHYSGKTTADELRECLLTIKAMIESSPRHLVHIITDVGDVTEPIKPQESVEVVREVGNHDRAGWNIVLRENSIIMKMLIAFGTSLLKMRTRAFDTVPEMEEFLSQQDTEIHWDKANKSLHPL